MKTILPLALLGCLALFARAESPEPAPADRKPTTLWRGQTYHSGGDTDAAAARIWTEEQWRALLVAARSEPPPAPPFKDNTVLFFDGGSCPTGGWQVDVVRAYQEKDGWIVEYRLVPPRPDSFVTQAFTHPLAAVIFENADLGRAPALRDVTPRDTRGRPVR